LSNPPIKVEHEGVLSNEPIKVEHSECTMTMQIYYIETSTREADNK